MKRLFLLAAFACILTADFFSVEPSAEYPLLKIKPQAVKIWKDVESMKGQSSRLDYYKPLNKNTDAAVIICPGGSYHHLGMFHEGKDAALWFCSRGISAFVLKYRVSGAGHHHPAMLQDIQRAIQLVREGSDEYGISRNKVGAIGFSAGGHLVLMAAVFGNEDVDELEKLDIPHEVSLAPDFIMPIYPVVSMQDDIAHKKSRQSLLFRDQSQERKDLFSMEMQTEKIKCPVFLMTNKDDRTVDYRNSVRLDTALTKSGVPHKFVLGEIGDHGFGMGNNDFVHSTKWNETILWPWLKDVLNNL